MRILLFGADGQAGAEVRRRHGGVIALTRRDCDLAKPGGARAAIMDAACDIVVNMAAYTAVDKAESEPETARAVNALAPAEMAEACAQRGLPFIHFSTDYVFDGGSSRPYREDDATAPLNVYGQTKLDGEVAVENVGGVYAILRTSWVFSAHGGNFVKTMLRLSDERLALRVVADQIGKPTPAAALADAAVAAGAALLKDPSKAGVYHVAGDEAVSWADFAEAIFAMAGRDIAVERIATKDYPTPAKRAAYSVLDTIKFHDAFAFPAPSWREGLADVLRELGAIKDEKGFL